nr:SPOR domain-containing protein [Streptomyces sp. NBC_00857]
MPRRPVRTRAVIVAMALAAVTSVSAPVSAQTATPGPADARVVTGSHVISRWTTQSVARGVEVRTGTVTNTAAAPTWTVTVEAPTTSRLTGAAAWAKVGPRSWADATATQLRGKGFRPRVDVIDWPSYNDSPRGPMGLRVRVGSYAAQDEADAAAKAITAAGFHTAVEWTGYDSAQPAGTENIRVAIIDPRTFSGTIAGTHDGNVARRETTSSVAAKQIACSPGSPWASSPRWARY